MRSSTILSIVALTAAVPSLAAPVVSPPQYTKRQTNNARDSTTPSETKRDVESRTFAPFPRPGRFPPPTFPKFPWNDRFAVAARADDLDESGAINWGKIIKWAPAVISTVASFLKREDIEDLLARGYDEQVAREFEDHFSRELVARDIINPEDLQSGAIQWAKIFKAAPTIINAATTIYDLWKGKRDIEGLTARDFEEVFTRELLARGDDESGAFWGAVLRWAPTIIKTVSGLLNKRDLEGLAARDFEELFTRELGDNLARDLLARDDAESGAFWGAVLRWAPTIIKTVSGLLNKRDLEGLSARDLEELVTREVRDQFAREILARGDQESGAFWGTLLKWAPTIISTVSSIFNKNKRDLEGLAARDFEELFTRELGEHLARDLFARDEAESGAFWGTLLKWAPTIINTVSGLFNKNRREVEELFARSALDARSLNELD